MQLARDPRSLLLDGRGGLALPLAVGEPHDLVRLQDALAHEPADPPRAAEEEPERHEVARDGLAADGEPREQGGSGCRDEVGAAAGDSSADRVARENDRAEERQRRVGIEHDESRHCGGEGEERDAPANGERREEKRCQQRVQPGLTSR